MMSCRLALLFLFTWGKRSRGRRKKGAEYLRQLNITGMELILNLNLNGFASFFFCSVCFVDV